MLKAVNLGCVRGDRQLFSGLGFELQKGELLHVKGVNGSGKTTLLRMICGLTSPVEGDILWQDENIHSLKEEYHKDIAYLGHLNGIKAELTGLENLRVSTALNGVKVTDEALWAALQRIGLRGFEDLPAKVLSQGQKRRVALARLLLSEASLWVLDEPFTALDVAAVALLESILGAHVEKGGMVVLTTHQDFTVTAGSTRHLHLGH